MSTKSDNPITKTVATTTDRATLKFGGALAIIGGLGYFVTLLLHGDLPDQSAETALDHIAGRPEWRVLKLSLIASVMCWLGAFNALASSLPAGVSKLLGRWSVSIATVGVATVVVEYAIIGHALKDVADTWRAASPTDREATLRLGEVMLEITGGLFHSFVAWLIGLPFSLLGVSIIVGRVYPQLLGWAALVAGAGAFLAGTTRFLGIELVPFPLLYGGFIIPLCFWLAVMGVFMWRKAKVTTI